jgi:type II secretion system protein D
MPSPKAPKMLLAASIIAAAGLPLSIVQAQPAETTAPPRQAGPAKPADTPSDNLKFNFKDAPIDQVLDFFARESGVPIIFEAPAPAGTITFVSSSSYTFEDALSIFNLNLQRFGVHLRKQDKYLYLATLADSMKKPSVVTDPAAVNNLSLDQIVTVPIPLDNAKAELVAEQVKPMVNPFGGVLAVPAQNMVIVVDTAAQVRRIRDVVTAIDSVKPVDSAFRLFPLQHAQADSVLAALKGLVGERTKTVIVDKDGQQRVVQDLAVQGLSLVADPRTNSIIAVGPAARIRTVEELIQLLDVPGGEPGTSGEVQMTTFTLASVTPEEAARQVTALFANVEPRQKPVVLPLAGAGKLTVVGKRDQVGRASALLSELDSGVVSDRPGGARVGLPVNRASTVRLQYASPQVLESMLTRLLTQKQLQTVKFASAPDSRSIVISGLDADVTWLESLVRALDVAPDADKDVRMVRVAKGDPAQVLARSEAMYKQTGRAEKDPVITGLDEGSRTITLVGSKGALATFTQILTTAEQAATIDQEARRFVLTKAQPSALAAKLARLARPLLTPTDGGAYVEPQFEAADEIRTLIVRAQPHQLEALAGLIEQLDSQTPMERVLRIVPIASEKAAAVRDKALAIYKAQVKELPNAQPVDVTVNEQSNSLMVIAEPEAMGRFVRILDELQRQAGPAREVRLIDLKLAKAAEVVDFLRGMVESSESMMIRGGPEPVFEAVEATNSILVAAQPAQFAVIESLVRGLDARQSAERPPMRILKLRSTDAANLATLLQQSFDARPIEERTKKPVTIQADAGTNTLIVSAAAEVLPEIEQVIAQLNEQVTEDGEREIRIFPLKIARAEELAKTIDQMYPQPPVPLDPRTRQPRPDLQPPKEVTVRADVATNSLIVDAPARRLAGFEQLVRSLDQTKLGESVVLRTYKIERADVNSVANTLRALAANGSFAPDGKPLNAPVTITAENSTRTLIVSAPQPAFAALEETLKTLDAAPALPATEMKLYALANARSERLQPLVERVLTQRARELQPEAATLPVRIVEVTSDAASNTLIVNAPRAVIAVADGLVQALDQKSAATGVEVRVFRLGKGDAATVGPAVAAAVRAQTVPGEPAVTVTPEPGSNTIVVVGTAAQIQKAAELIESMDTTADKDGVGVKTITLKHARAESLAPVLEGVLRSESALDKLPDWARVQAMARGMTERPQVRVVPERALNALVISGPRNVLEVAEQVIAQLDVDPAERSGDRPVRVITLQNSDAATLAANLQAVFAEEKSKDPAPTIRVDTQSNSLIVRATPAQLEQVDELTRKLDAAAVNSSRQMRMVSVDRSRVDAELLASTLRRLLEQQGGVKVEVISAEELLKQNDPPAEAPPKKVGAQDERGLRRQVEGEGVGIPAAVAPVLAAVIAQPEPEATEPAPQPENAAAQRDEFEAGLTIAVDKATNTLMLVGSPRLTDRVAALAETLQRQMPSEPVGVRIISLPTGTDLDSLTAIVRQTTQQIGRASAANPGGFSGPVSILPDHGASSLIVLSNDTDFATVGRLVGTLAQSSKTEAVTVKVYPLTSVTAARAIASLRDLFSPSPVGRQAQRVRAMEMTLPGAESPTRIDPGQVRMTPDPGGASVIVAAPKEAFPLIDRLIETIDQSPVRDRLAIRRYELKNARAQELSRTLQSLFDAQRQGPGASEIPQARFVADDRTNSILVTASGPQHADVERLLETADTSLDQGDRELAIITLQQAAPSTVQRIVEAVVIGRDPAKRDRVRISAQDGSSLFVVHAPKEDIAEVREIVSQVDAAETSGLPVHSIKLERADASVVAQALQKFFTDRAAASSRPGMRAVNRVAVVGDRRTGTLIVSASPDDFAQVESLVKTFDTPTPMQDFQFKVVPLRHARVLEISNTIKQVVDEMRWETMFGDRNRQDRDEHRLYVEGNESTNSIVLVGRGDGIEAAERVIAALDQPPEQRAAIVVRSVVVKTADVAALRNVLQRAFSTPGWRSWRGPDPEAVTVEVDKARRALILLGKAERVEQALSYVQELDGPAGSEAMKIEAITLTHARADRASQSLRQFFADRAKAQGVEASPVSVIGSQDGNVIIASGPEEDLRTLRDLVAQIDQPDGGKDRRIEVFVLKNSTARDTADALRAMFARSPRPDEQVIITPQPSTNSLIVSAPAASFEDIVALLRQLDSAPKGEEANIETVALTSARAQEVATALRAALPPAVKVTITPVVRSNSLMLTGSKEAIALVMEHIRKLDTEPVRSGLVFRRFRIANADATDVAYTVEQMLRARPRSANEAAASIDYSRQDNTLTVYAPADQIEEIDRIVRELDTPVGEDRTTEFVKLEFAKAESTAAALKNFYGRYAPEAATPGARSVTIISDPVSNSLVIRADKNQWEGIRQLLSKLDTKEYDTARQLAVIPLAHADAASVAKALNEGLRAPLEEQFRQAQARAAAAARGVNNQRPQFIEPTVLVAAEDLPTVSAEPLTNSVIVFASKKDLDRIEGIVKQLDVAGFDQMPMPRIIPLKSGKPSAVASSIRELYLNRQPNQRVQGPKAVLIIGDDSSGALIVRADDEKFAQIKALAETLEQQGQIGRVTPHVVPLKNVAAGRLRQTLLATFTETAKSQGETLAIEVDRSSNSLVIASSARLLEEIKRVIDELDAANTPAPDAVNPGQTPLSAAFTIIDVHNNSPAEMKKLLDDMGLTRPQNLDQRGVVSEPVTIVPMSSRRALAVIASPADARAVEGLVRALDAEPADAQQQIAVIPLKMASAKPLADTLAAMLKPADPATQAGQTGPARALAEQIRRLGLSKSGINQTPLTVDLSKPIRLIPDIEANSLIIASTQANIDALREVIKLLDALPIGDAVLVRIFNLENASATRVKTVIEQLFAQGEEIRRLPGTRRQGLPPTATGQALAGEIAVTVDERTNSLIVAAREEAVALVEILVRDLDSDRAGKWVEPVIIPLKHADSSTLAATLNTILVRGLASTPEAIGLQRQYGRLRMLAENPEAAASSEQGTPPNFVEADLFAPLHGLVIVAEAHLNSLIVVGTPANTQVVRQLVAMLDVEAASAANAVRVYPLKHASSDRVAAVVRDLFRQRESLPDQRPEDRLVISSDVRTNSVIAATSPKSFAILEGLIKTLDSEQANPTVGLHVVPVTAGDVRQLAPRIDRLMRERLAAASRAGAVSNPLDAFSIEPEPTSNLLIVAASNENLQVVKELVAALSQGADTLAKSERMDIIQLTRSRAAEVADSLNRLYVEKEVARRGPGSVGVTANERLNSIIIHGNESDMIELRALANKLDTAEVIARQQIKWIELKSANAAEVVRLLQSVLAGRPLSGGQARQAMKVQFLRDRLHDEVGSRMAAGGRKPTEADIDGAIKDQVTLNADVRTNSIWITAPEPIVKLLTEMIEDIEASSAGARKIEYFKLTNADARQMAEVLRDTFNLRQQGNALVLVPVGQQTTPEQPADQSMPGGIGDTSVTAVPDERQALSIAVDARTNTLIVSGTADYLELVGKLVKELDSIEANERERRVYSLRNAKAKEIEATLRSYFNNESLIERSTLGPQLAGSLMRRLEEEVTVVGDENSNKLVISTSPRYMNTVLSIIDELDAAPPQVMIQVLLAEVTLDNTDTWGMDVTVGPFGGEGYKIGSTPAGASVATALGVPNLSVSSADFGILIRSLEEQGKLEVLSNPQVMVNNNQTAKIQVGENVAVVNGVERSSVGSSFANIIREDVGIILNVVPSISADGFVRMDIQPEISQLSTKTTQISSDVAAPVINKRAVDTVVTVKDGQSVVIGGLIQTTEEQRRTKVPYLADIPILGLPFRTKKDTNVKTELLVILTPRVIPGEAGVAEPLIQDVTEQAVQRMEDPGKIEDYLERIRQEVKEKRAKEAEALQNQLYGDQESASPGSMSDPASSTFEPSRVMPSPSRSRSR